MKYDCKQFMIRVIGIGLTGKQMYSVLTFHNATK